MMITSCCLWTMHGSIDIALKRELQRILTQHVGACSSHAALGHSYTLHRLLYQCFWLSHHASAGCAQGQLLWRGPRVKMGLFEGSPTAVVPHPASGRADYFGTLCNRSVKQMPPVQQL